jgi:hypothetical protein
VDSETERVLDVLANLTGDIAVNLDSLADLWL